MPHRFSTSAAGGILLTLLLNAGCATPSTPARHPADSAAPLLHPATRLALRDVPAGDIPPDPDAIETFDDYWRTAFARNPELRAAFERRQAALARIPQARALEDPAVSFEYLVEQKDARYRASLTQSFPPPGARSLRERRAAAEAEAALHAFDAERFELYERVVRGFYEYLYLHRAIAVTEEHHRLLTDLEQAVAERYRAGDAPFADLIQIQTEKEKLADRLAALREERRPQSAALSALVHRPSDIPLPSPRATPTGALTVDEAELAGRLEELNPVLKAAESDLAAAGHGAALARRDGWPGFMLGVGWMVMPGMEGRGDESDVGLMAGISLPVWRGRYRAARREAAAEIRAATHIRDALRDRVRSELSRAVFRFRDAERRLELYDTSLVPKAEQAVAVARQAYAEGRTGFMTVIDTQRSRLEFRLMSERAAIDREIALGEIRCCIGGFEDPDPP